MKSGSLATNLESLEKALALAKEKWEGCWQHLRAEHDERSAGAVKGSPFHMRIF